MNRPNDRLARPAASALFAAAISLTLLGCGVPVDPSVRGIDSVPYGLMRTTTSTSSTTTTTSTLPAPTVPIDTSPDSVLASSTSTTIDPTVEVVPLFFVTGDRFVEERRTVPANLGLRDVVLELIRGPMNTAGGSVFASSSINFGDVLDVRLEAGLATVELSNGFSALPAAEQRRLVGQLVLTLASQRGVGQVRFTLDGNPLDVPQGDGTFGTDALSRDSFAALVDIAADSADDVVAGSGAASGAEPQVSSTLATASTSTR